MSGRHLAIVVGLVLCAASPLLGVLMAAAVGHLISNLFAVPLSDIFYIAALSGSTTAMMAIVIGMTLIDGARR